LLETLNRNGLTLLLVTHDPRVAAHARRVLVMRDGQIVEEKINAPA
jgi:ABC-type lipoprotein export system ATPase subunit